MPKGIPSSGKRKPGAGRPRKYGDGIATEVARVPVGWKGKLEDLSLFFAELDAELATWEAAAEGKDLEKNPRWVYVTQLMTSIRERLDALELGE